jgi:hypothetical protein
MAQPSEHTRSSHEPPDSLSALGPLEPLFVVSVYLFYLIKIKTVLRSLGQHAFLCRYRFVAVFFFFKQSELI